MMHIVFTGPISRGMPKNVELMIPKSYPARDDGFKIWDALQELATKIINYFYSEDKDIEEDLEIQNWAADIGFRGYRGHDFPAKESLIEHCTLIMFTGSAQHSIWSIHVLQICSKCSIWCTSSTPNRERQGYKLATLPNDFTASSAVGENICTVSVWSL